MINGMQAELSESSSAVLTRLVLHDGRHGGHSNSDTTTPVPGSHRPGRRDRGRPGRVAGTAEEQRLAGAVTEARIRTGAPAKGRMTTPPLDPPQPNPPLPPDPGLPSPSP